LEVQREGKMGMIVFAKTPGGKIIKADARPEMTITELKHELQKHPSLSFLGPVQGQGRGYFSLKSKAAKLPDHATLHDLSIESQQMLTMHLEEEPVAQEGIVSKVQPQTQDTSFQFHQTSLADEASQNSRGMTNMPTLKEASYSETGSSPQRLLSFHPLLFSFDLSSWFPPAPSPAPSKPSFDKEPFLSLQSSPSMSFLRPQSMNVGHTNLESFPSHAPSPALHQTLNPTSYTPFHL
jgi:hypothetical protein